MSHVEITRRGRVLEVKLNKPKVNAIDVAMSQELGAAFAMLRATTACRAPAWRAIALAVWKRSRELCIGDSPSSGFNEGLRVIP